MSGPHKYFMSTCAKCGTPRRIRSDYPATLCRLCSRPRKHGLEGTPLYDAYRSMLARCGHRPSAYPGVHYYAGRGIEVCEAWRLDRTLFFGWALANGYQPGLILDRRDNDLGYNPENCRWVTAPVSGRNRRSTKLNADIVREIRTILREDASWGRFERLGRQFGVSPTTIHNIHTQRLWREDTI